jgi:hypothetical protein
MADKIRRVEYFYLQVDDRPGEGAEVLGKLKDTGVNLLSFTAFPTAGGKAQLTIVPERPDAFLAAARNAGLTHSAKKECFLVQGEDHVGAVYDVLKRLAESKINCVASNGGSAPGGGYSLVVFVKPGDLAGAAKALGA